MTAAFVGTPARSLDADGTTASLPGAPASAVAAAVDGLVELGKSVARIAVVRLAMDVEDRMRQMRTVWLGPRRAWAECAVGAEVVAIVRARWEKRLEQGLREASRVGITQMTQSVEVKDR